MAKLTSEQREFLVLVEGLPGRVFPHQEPVDSGFSSAIFARLTQLGLIHRTHRGFELTTSGREVVRPTKRTETGRGIPHHLSRNCSSVASATSTSG